MLIAEEHEATQKSQGGDRRSSEFSNDQNGHLKGRVRTAIAKEHGIGEGSVQRAVEMKRGIDKAAEVDPDFKRDVLSGVVKAKKSDLAAIRKLESPEEVKDAIEAIRNPPPKPHKPKAPADPEAAAKRAEARKKSVGGQGANQHTKVQLDQNDPIAKPHSTAEAIAREKAFRFTDALLSFSEFFRIVTPLLITRLH